MDNEACTNHFEQATMEPTLFTHAGSGRGANDALNAQREKILGTLYHLPTTDPYWMKLQTLWRTCIDSLCPLPFDGVRIEQRGGRRYHYDFHVFYTLDNTVVFERKLEYKHNSSSVETLPQFLSLLEHTGILPSYAYFYYTRYLKAYLACDPAFPEAIPDLTTYLQKVRSTDYSIHPFFQALYDREEIEKDKKQAIVKESIRVFLQEHAGLLDVKKLKHIFAESQRDKVFVLWDLEQFHTQELRFEVPLASCGINEKGHTLLVTDGTRTFHLMLRWRNHMGILNPAWQISLGK